MSIEKTIEELERDMRSVAEGGLSYLLDSQPASEVMHALRHLDSIVIVATGPAPVQQLRDALEELLDRLEDHHG